MAEYRLPPPPERDLEGIWKYTRREWGLEQAERCTDLLTAAFQVLPKRRSSLQRVIIFDRAIAAASLVMPVAGVIRLGNSRYRTVRTGRHFGIASGPLAINEKCVVDGVAGPL
jgi:hypothetical protein